MRPPRLLLLVLCVLGVFARAEEPFFKKGDVIAIVGGEDMVALSEYGYLELLLTRALPDYHLRFRNLAWEGDTVFEQRRDLGFPTWEEQLAKIGATVVLCQFGQMESLAGKEKLPEFIAAYEKLLGRLGGEGKRRIVIVTPVIIPGSADFGVLGDWRAKQDERLRLGKEGWAPFLDYSRAITDLAAAHQWRFVTLMSDLNTLYSTRAESAIRITRDGIHFNEDGQRKSASVIAISLTSLPDGAIKPLYAHRRDPSGKIVGPEKSPLRDLIIAKNRLWFDYWRVQNWAFLAGDRTNQPSSRDHLDPAKRWFPEERERFLPLIKAREKEIDTLAAQLAQP